ncbi:hypothetical protein [Pseudoalteromonas phage PH357]|nr:hypothetical protein [Pseudoalteromonas phage PH357]
MKFNLLDTLKNVEIDVDIKKVLQDKYSKLCRVHSTRDYKYDDSYLSFVDGDVYQVHYSQGLSYGHYDESDKRVTTKVTEQFPEDFIKRMCALREVINCWNEFE